MKQLIMNQKMCDHFLAHSQSGGVVLGKSILKPPVSVEHEGNMDYGFTRTLQEYTVHLTPKGVILHNKCSRVGDKE